MRLASKLVEVKFNNQVANKVFFAFVLICKLPITMIALTFEEFSTLSSPFVLKQWITWTSWNRVSRFGMYAPLELSHLYRQDFAIHVSSLNKLYYIILTEHAHWLGHLQDEVIFCGNLSIDRPYNSESERGHILPASFFCLDVSHSYYSFVHECCTRAIQNQSPCVFNGSLESLNFNEAICNSIFIVI